MMEPRPSNVIERAYGRIASTITLRIGSSKPGAPAASVIFCSRSTVRSCASTVVEQASATANAEAPIRMVMVSGL
jgi:hypothetical protein